MSLRILITGSRDWVDQAAVADALLQAIPERLVVPDEQGAPRVLWDQITVVHGDARGADRTAGRIAQHWGMRVEPHPADWDKHGKRAGPIRNEEMVRLGADVCLAFPLGMSRGTRDCMGRARAAGIPVISYEPKGPS